jgi:signal transduction histidine kinase/CheY-like chemotaxis protein/HPt (histidine-containing phosphotransfer) domain-containing protein
MDRFKKESLSLLSNIADSVSKAYDAQSLADALFRVVDDFVDVKYSSIFLWDFTEKRLRLLANKGFTEEEKIDSEKTVMERHPGWVFNNRKPIHVRDMESETLPDYIQSGKRTFQVRSRLWLPITTAEKSLGAFGFASEKKDYFTEEHTNILELVCRLGGNIYSNIVFSQSEKQYLDSIKLSMKKLQQANDAQQNFISRMSHEMRTPLNGIIGMSALLSNSALNEDQNYLIDIINDQSVVLLSLINDLLDVSKIESNEFRLVNYTFNVQEAISSAVRSHQLHAEQKNISLKNNVDKNLDIFVQGDSLRLAQIINNLLNNAIKFTRKGEVSIHAGLKSQTDNNCKILIRVNDTGIGILPEKIESIFGRFVQADESMTRNHGGTGLGLYITRELVRKMNGTIEVQSKPGEGTTFTIELDFNKIEDNNATPGTGSEYIFDGLKILIAEDNLVNSFYLKTLLGSLGAEVESAEDGLHAVELCRKNTYDIILMDLQMPQMDGIAASVIIRNELNLSTPILAQSANTVQKDIDACFRAGINDYISKPFSPDQLKTRIGLLLKLKTKDQKNQGDSGPKHLEHPIFKKALELANQNADLANHLTSLFIKELPKTVASIKNACQDKNLKELNRLGHKYKSSFRLFAQDDAAALCYQLEKANLDSNSWPEMESVIEKIEVIAQCILSELNSFSLATH